MSAFFKGALLGIFFYCQLKIYSQQTDLKTTFHLISLISFDAKGSSYAKGLCTYYVRANRAILDPPLVLL